MSYYSNLTAEEKSKIKIVSDSFSKHYEKVKIEFKQKHPLWDFSKTVLKIENTVFSGVCNFTGNFEEAIEIKGCYFLNDAFFYDCNFGKRISISHSYFEKEVRIEKNSVFKESFDLVVVYIQSQMFVSGGVFNECKWCIKNNGVLKIDGGDFSNLNIGYWGGVILEELSFHFPRIKGNIRITDENSKIQNLLLFQFSPDVSLAIEDVSVNLLSIYRFRNEKSFRIFNIKGLRSTEPTEFSICESYFGNTEIYSVDFNQFENFYLTDVHLVDTNFVNVNWKYEIESLKGRGISKSEDEKKLPIILKKLKNQLLENYDEIENLKKNPIVVEYFQKNRETYRQLKHAMSKQGDVVNEQKFHSKEMMAYNRTIDFDKDPFTKLIIKMSYWFSDFGQSLTRPLIWLLFGHFGLFLILLICDQIEGVTLDIMNGTAEGFKNAVEQYFRLINPLRRAENTYKGYSIILDLLMRSWASYMIYNIIRATRRFIK